MPPFERYCTSADVCRSINFAHMLMAAWLNGKFVKLALLELC